MSRERSLFYSFIENLNPKIVFEFGSFDLTDGLYYRDLWPDAEIYCSEPNPQLYKNIKQSAKQANIKLFPYAFSDVDDVMMDFYPSIGVNGIAGPTGSLLVPTAELKKGQAQLQTFSDPIKVKTRTIESFCVEHNINRIDFMHMDVEGAVRLVAGGFGSIRPSMIRAEVHGRDRLFHGAFPTRFMNLFMEELGYKILISRITQSADILYEYGNNTHGS